MLCELEHMDQDARVGVGWGSWVWVSFVRFKEGAKLGAYLVSGLTTFVLGCFGVCVIEGDVNLFFSNE